MMTRLFCLKWPLKSYFLCSYREKQGAMAQQQYYGIRYPFTSTDEDNFYVDVNYTLRGKVRSQIMHIIFTPKGQRIRDPEFGTDLIKHIFEPNDDTTWEGVKAEVTEALNMYATNIKLNNIDVLKNSEDPSQVFVRIDYSVIEGNKETKDSIITKI